MNVERFISQKLAWQEKKSFSRFIIIIAITAIALSMSIMIVATCMVNGFTSEIKHKIFGFWGEIHIHKMDNNSSFEETPVHWKDIKINQLKKIPAVKSVTPYINKAAIFKTKHEIDGVILKGVDSSFDWQFISDYLVDGKPIQYNATDRFAKEIIISQQKANVLNLKIGDAVIVYFLRKNSTTPIGRKLKIVGIYKTGLEEYDSKFSLVDLRLLQQINDWDSTQMSGVEVRLNDLDKINEVNDEIYYTIIDNTMYSETIQQINPNIFEWLKLQKINEIIILAIMLLVAILNMITALIILILDRTKMIGILKALGAKNSVIRGIFLYQSMYIISRAIIIGNIIGLGLCFLQQQTGFIKLNEENYYVSHAPIAFDWIQIIAINIGAFVICVLVLYIPSRLVAKISPLNAIRFN